MNNKTWFERAVFLSWYCAKGDCKFCYMSTQKNLISDPKKARRSKASILAEVFLCKHFGWKIEFLSGGYESYSQLEILELLKYITKIYEHKVWLNIGVLKKKELEMYKPYIRGVCGAVECVNPKVHDRVCPSKPIKEIEYMYKICNELKLKKAMTLILGIGESLDDIELLKQFITKNNIDKITFYRLKPQKDTIFEGREPISSEYYVKWIKEIRGDFPEIKITVGSWFTHLDEIHMLLDAGADAITKFPSIKLFGSEYAKNIEYEAKIANKEFEGTLTQYKKFNKEIINNYDFDDNLKKDIIKKIDQYFKKIN